MIRRLILPILLTAPLFFCTAEDPAPINGQRSTLFDILMPDSTSIVMLGNSLTNGCEWHELFGMPNVLNRGISGDTTADIAARLESIVAGKPAKIFLMSGVNDISHDMTADEVASDIIALMDRIQRETPETRLYVQSLLPINNSFGRYKRVIGKEQVIRDVNSILIAECSKRGIPFIDIHNSMTDNEGNLKVEYTNDGLHLLGRAYIIWRDILLPYIKE